MTETQKQIEQSLQQLRGETPETSSTKPRKTAGLVLAALAAVCCFQVGFANAETPQNQQSKASLLETTQTHLVVK